ncbi:MAG: hypothetical protein RI967_1645, partial [Planctomycetota bacterium]
GMLVAATLRALVSVQPQVLFDVDPARDPMPLLALGPAASHLLDAIVALSALVAILGERLAGRGVRAWPFALALAGGAMVAWHGAGDAGDAFRGGTWLAAILAFAALAHLVREPRLRVVALSVLLASSVPLAARGAVQILVEHPATVAAYEENRAAFLADRGWTPDSSATRTYERRLRQAEATGWFGLSNPFSTVMAACGVGLSIVAVGAVRRRRTAESAALGVAALAALALLAANGGKGAIAAAAAGAVVGGLVAAGRALPRGAVVTVGAALAVGAVVARGAVGTSLGELSVLFRSFYLEGAARLLALHPATGVGPDGVQAAFMAVKPANCPEDVTSIHSIFVDWLVALGVPGGAWMVLVALAFRGRLDASAAPSCVDGDDPSPVALRIAAIVAVAALVAGALVEGPALDAATLGLRAAALAAMVAVAALAARALARLSARTLAAASLAFAFIAVVHAQIEVTAWIPGGAVLALAAAACGTTLGAGGSRPGAAFATVAAIASAALSLAWWSDARALDARLEAAASEVRPLAELRASFAGFARSRAAGGATDAAPFLEAALLAGGEPARAALARAVLADEPAAVDAALVAIDGAARRRAAAILVDASDRHPRSRVPIEAAIKQLAAAGRRATGVRSGSVVDTEAFREACRLADRAIGLRPDARAYAMRADLAMEELRARPAPDAAGDSARSEIELAARLLEPIEGAAMRQPFSARRLADLGEALARAGRPAEAERAFTRALEADDRASLDPLAQLSERERALLRAARDKARDAAASADSPAGDPPAGTGETAANPG